MSKVIVIVGGSDGIGKTTLVSLLSQDNKVYNLSRSKIEGFNDNIICDVSNKESIKSAFLELSKKEKKIDVVIYCAGFSMASPIVEVQEDDYRYLYEVILFGYIGVLKEALCLLRANTEGKVVFLSSLASSIPIPYDPYYSSAKSAVEVLNNCVNIELNKENIYLTNLIFGGVKTNFTYKRKVYNVEDKNMFYNAVNSLASIEQKGQDSADIAKAVLKILDMKKPPLNYVVGIKDKIVYKLSKVLSDKIINKVVKYKFKMK